MLKIAFIIAFGGLIAHMAQTNPSNQYDMEICPEIFNTYIGKQCPRDLIMPLPEEISITRSRGLLSGSVEYTVNNLLQKGLVHVTVSLMTVSGKKLLVDVDARVRVGGIFCNSRDMDSQTKVEMLVHVHFSFFTELHLQSMGKLHCGKLPNKGAFIVNGGVQFLDGDVLGDPELQPVLRELCAKFESYIKANSATLVEQLQKATIKGLEELLAGMTTPELTEESPKQEGCTQKIKDVNTDGPNIKLIVETTHVIPAGNQVSASEIPKPIPLPVAGTDTGSQWVLTDAQINNMLKTLATKKLTLTDNLEAFSVALKEAGVNVPPVTKVVLTPTQPPQVAIAGNRITGQLGGTLVLYAGDQKIVTANGTLTIDGRLEYNAPCVNILTNFVGMGDVHVVESAPGYNCEGINGMDKQFTAIITGKAFIEACVACSPAASLPPPCSTEIRPMEGYAIIDHKRSI